MKIEVPLSQSEHELLMEVASHERSHRSLASITRGLLVGALMGEVKKMCSGNRPKASASLVAASKSERRKL